MHFQIGLRPFFKPTKKHFPPIIAFTISTYLTVFYIIIEICLHFQLLNATFLIGIKGFGFGIAVAGEKWRGNL